MKMKFLCESLFKHPEFREGRHWSRRRYAASDVIVTEGEQGRELLLVRHGTVRVTGCAELEQGGVIHPVFSDLGAGELFGESALLPGARRTATVAAVTECELAVIDGERLLSFFEAHPRTGYRFMLTLYALAASRLAQTSGQLLKVLAWGLRAHRIESHLEPESEVPGGEFSVTGRSGW